MMMIIFRYYNIYNTIYYSFINTIHSFVHSFIVYKTQATAQTGQY